MPAGTGIRRRRRAVEAVTRSSTHSKSGKKIDSEGADVKSGYVSGHPGVQLLTPFSPSHIDDNPSSSAHSGHGSVPPRGRGGQRLRGMAGVGQSARHGRGRSERETLVCRAIQANERTGSSSSTLTLRRLTTTHTSDQGRSQSTFDGDSKQSGKGTCRHNPFALPNAVAIWHVAPPG